eukprot:TRINITY_DN12104_c0_g2_i5.p1 TRINITY_DN12104_c0_g2~~TRINITY_DN12104_c0_g2_i5.p1  ORF type:complete len:205 (-),score=38.30 TRINITY_DN12104_c0_g2_i5:642-1256(-)
MSPLVFSERDYEDKRIEWVQDTYDVTYNKSSVVKNQQDAEHANQNARRYYTLSFSYEFKHTSDKVYFAFSRPYTLSMHFALLNKIKDNFFESNAKITFIESNTLQQRIKEFISTPIEPKAPEESPHKKRGRKSATRKEVTILKEHPYISSEVLREFNGSAIQPFEWMKCEEFQAESEGVVYKQEVLCRSFCGIPIVLLTITNVK